MTSAGVPAPKAREDPLQPVQLAAPQIAAYHPPPSYPPPIDTSKAATDSRAVVALLVAVLGLVLGLPLGVPGLVCGPIAYFMGRSAGKRIEASAGALGGRSLAVTAWILGIVATAVGAVVSLLWLIVFLVSVSGPTTY